MLRTFKVTLAYDGTDFAGWQVQPGQRTVQAVLEEALQQITGEATRVIASGRTDSGVHALGQVASFRVATRLDCRQLQKALDVQTPEDVVIRDVQQVADDFHAIRNAVSKRYRYVLHDGPDTNLFVRRYAWRVAQALDVDRMHQAAQLLQGKHDFASFQAVGAPRLSTIRTIHHVSVCRREIEQGTVIHFEVEADGFLYNMVRILVGSLVPIGMGKYDSPWLQQVLDARDRNLAGPTAPPHGLFLMHVSY